MTILDGFRRRFRWKFYAYKWNFRDFGDEGWLNDRYNGSNFLFCREGFDEIFTFLSEGVMKYANNLK